MSVQMPVFSHPPIDIHSHFNHGSPFDCPRQPIHYRSADFIKAAYDRFGIVCAGMSTYGAVLEHPECIPEENLYLHGVAAQTDWIYQWVVIDPRQEKTFEQAAAYLSHPKTLGIKIHPSYHRYDVTEYADAIFSFADKHRATVLMHPQSITKMPMFADKYPNMNLIIAHLNSMEHIAAMETAKHGNIYTDTSAGGSGLNNVIEYAVSRVGSEKILFGTDTYACSYAYPRIALADLPQEDKENILFKNALRLFPHLS